MKSEIATGKKTRRYLVGIVELNQSFRPADWSDAPPSAVVVELPGRGRSRAEAESWIFGFNTAAIRKPCGQWAILLEDDGFVGPGDFCVRRLACFRRAEIPQQTGKRPVQTG